MMDAFSILISLTLACTGVFLCRDYARFLRGSYAVTGRVKAIQQVFRFDAGKYGEVTSQPLVANGFYPVIEYENEGATVCFTAIDQIASSQVHVGDSVRLRITKSRRHSRRTNTMVTLLIALLSSLGLAMVLGPALFAEPLSVLQIILASLTITVCLAVLVFYARDKDEYHIHDTTRTPGGRIQLCLCEPTAFQKWQRALCDPAQTLKIRSSQAFGATCVCFAMVVLAVALHPLWLVNL